MTRQGRARRLKPAVVIVERPALRRIGEHRQPRGELVVAAVAARMGHAEPELVGHHDGGEPFVFAAGFQLQPQRIGQAPAPAVAPFGRSAFFHALVPGRHGASSNAVKPACR